MHVCVDDATRLAYVEVLADEKGHDRRRLSAPRASLSTRSHGIRVERVMTDNGAGYRSILHALACRALGLRHLRTRPYRPRTNGKAERFIRTMLGGWAYGAIYGTSAETNHEPSQPGSTTTIAADHTAASTASHPSPASRR